MVNKFKYFLKHSIVYGISSAAVKASGIILIPIYTKYFTVEEFGRLGLILAVIAILVQVFVMGQNQSLLRFINQINYQGKRKSIFYTITIFVVLTNVLFVLIGEKLSPFIAQLFGNLEDYNSSLKIAVFIVAFSIINNIFQSKLRADERSTFFTVLNLIKLIALIIVTVFLVAFQKNGINGVLYAQLVSEILGLIIVLPMMIQEMELKFEKKFLIESLKFGIPLIFAGLSMTLLNISDRFVIKFLDNEKSLGLYELGYRIAGILNMFLVIPMTLTFVPIAYKVYKQPNDKEYFSKIMTYFTFIIIWGALFLSIFSKEILIIFSKNSEFIPAYSIIPLILYSYVFLGMSIISSVGIFLDGRTIYSAIVTIIATAFNIGLNFILIPKIGIMGAAISTLIAFAILFALNLIFSNYFYKIQYEYRKLVTLFILSLILLTATYFLSDLHFWIDMVIKVIFIIIFPFILVLFSFYEKKEIELIKKLSRMFYNPKLIIETIKKETKSFF
jgi:O-antigen/teichoic acid export membrane protein